MFDLGRCGCSLEKIYYIAGGCITGEDYYEVFGFDTSDMTN